MSDTDEFSTKQMLEWSQLLEDNLRYHEQLEDEVLSKTRELREGRERYQRLLESVTNYVYTVTFENGSPTETIHQCGCEKLTGYTSDEFNANPNLWYSIVHEEDRPDVVDMSQRIQTHSDNLEREHRIRHKDGSLRWIRSTLVPHRDKEGTLFSYDCIISDITDRKLAEIKQRESEEHFSQLFLQHEDAITLFRFDTFEIFDANPAATLLYGYSRDELLCTFPWPFLADGQKEFRESLHTALSENGRFDIFKITQIRKDGTPVIVSIRGKLVKLMDAMVVYCSTRSIQEKIRLEEEVLNTQAKLIQANKMASLGMLASGVAHEINNPNNFIMFNSSLLAETWPGILEILDEYAEEHGDFQLAGQRFSEIREETPRLLAGLTEGARRIQAIVEALKGVVRQEQDDFGTCIDINRIIQMAMTLLSHEIRKRACNVSVELASDLPLVSGKPQLIEQVMINLVTNAINAVAENGGSIKISTVHEQTDGFVVISVRDEGVGMTPEVLARINEPFFTTRPDQGGTGLGVSISVSIIKDHNGTLTYHSEPGKGTTAMVRLPDSDRMHSKISPAKETL